MLHMSYLQLQFAACGCDCWLMGETVVEFALCSVRSDLQTMLLLGAMAREHPVAGWASDQSGLRSGTRI